MEDAKSFLGQGLKFPLQVDPKTGKFAMVSGEDDIKEAIGIILRTIQGERIMRPGFGSNVMEYMFAPVNDSMDEGLAFEIQEELTYQEPRIRDVQVSISGGGTPDGSVIADISYVVRSTNNRYNHVYPFYVTEGSEGGGGE